MLRRSHKKSRRGCLECKRRHIKVRDVPIYHGASYVWWVAWRGCPIARLKTATWVVAVFPGG